MNEGTEQPVEQLVQNIESRAVETPAEPQTPQTPQTPDAPEMIGDLEIGAVNSALAAKFGEGISLEKVEGLMDIQGKYEQLNADYEAAKVKFEQSRYASPMVEKIDEMVRGGGKLPELMKFMSLQNLNFEEMKPEDLIKEKIAIERPTWTRDEVNDYYFQQYPPLDEDAEEREIRDHNIKVKAASEDAKKYLEEQMVATESPQAIADREKEQAEYVKKQSNYGVVVDSLMKHTKQIPYEVVVDKNTDQKYTFGFNVPENGEIFQQVRDLVVNDAIKNGIPMNEKGVEQMQNAINGTLKAVYHEQIVEAIIHDSFASARELFVRGSSNPNPVPKGSGASSVPAPKKKETIKTVKGQTFV